MKPISELVNDRAACERIAELIIGEQCMSLRIGDADSGVVFRAVSITGYYTPFFLDHEGTVTLNYEVAFPSINPFTFVALMNELGYGPKRECSDDSPGWAYRDVERT